MTEQGATTGLVPALTLGLVLPLVLAVGGCNTGPTEGSVYLRNGTARAVSIEIVTSSGGWFPSTIDETITVAGATGQDCNQTMVFVAPGPVTIRLSGPTLSGMQTVSFTEAQPGTSTTPTDVDHTLDIDSAGHAVLAPGDPPASWQCPRGPSDQPVGSG